MASLLKKDAFSWSPEAQNAFEKLKLAMTSAPVLTLPNFSKPFVIETDASSQGIGTVMMQDGHPSEQGLGSWLGDTSLLRLIISALSTLWSKGSQLPASRNG